ncbi:MAG: undecaprenyl/decaprenyl-phosphate alpha-N-acetylglucosaminyl 1-phosphate transferase [Bacteroidetes bacterium]|nr:undecaprenyl/decaprenyl-phosphate alpha-N-acetylglucosaminyl 1-phosphate transferase [Bacteroidota bacterium]
MLSNFPFPLLLIHAVFFLCSVFFSFLINGLLLKFVRTLGIRNEDEATIRWSVKAKPALGGLSFYIIFLFSITSYSILFEKNALFENHQFIGVLLASTIGFMLGLFDDAYNTKPWLKLFAQISCAFTLIVSGTYIHMFSNVYLDYIFTIFWVVGIMNSINLLDNMDAVSTFVSSSILITIITTIILQNDFSNPLLFITTGVLASLIGFLYYNWNPSKMFMGDTGSQFLGVFLASVGIVFFWNVKETSGNEIPNKQLMITLLAFIVPIIDTFTVVIKRLSMKKSPFIGGKDHTTHHLSYLGFSDRTVSLIILAISLFSSFLIILLLNFIEWKQIYFVPLIIYFIAVFAILFYISNINKKDANHP